MSPAPQPPSTAAPTPHSFDAAATSGAPSRCACLATVRACGSAPGSLIVFRHVVMMRWAAGGYGGAAARGASRPGRAPGPDPRDPELRDRDRRRRERRKFRSRDRRRLRRPRRLSRVPRPSGSPGLDPRPDPADRGRSRGGAVPHVAGRRRSRTVVSVWLEQARSYPSGVVATPHYLATSAGLAMLAGGGRGRRGPGREPRAGRRDAVHVRSRRRSPRQVWDGDVQAYRGVGRAPSGATLDGVREQSGSATMPTFGPHACTVPGAVDGWFTLLERWGTRSFRRGQRRRPALRERRLPAHAPRSMVLHAASE